MFTGALTLLADATVSSTVFVRNEGTFGFATFASGPDTDVTTSYDAWYGNTPADTNLPLSPTDLVGAAPRFPSRHRLLVAARPLAAEVR